MEMISPAVFSLASSFTSYSILQLIKNAIANQVTDRDLKQSRSRKGAVEPGVVEVFRELDQDWTAPLRARLCRVRL